MIDQFYSYPSSWERLRLGPLGPYIDAFAQHLSERGYARPTARHKIRAVAGLSSWLEKRQRGVEDLDEQVVSEFLRYRRRKGLSRYEAPPALRALLSHLRDAGIIGCAPGRVESPLHAIEQRFALYLTQERGLAKPTIDNYLPIARTFLSERFGSKPIALDELTPRDITGFIVCYANRVSLRRAQLVTTALRSLFRFLYERGEISTDLACSVPTVASWRLSDLPKFLEPEHVERLLKSCNRSAPTGRRDYAVLLLLARLGLRAGEVVHMKLDDIDWERGELMVRGKSLRRDRLPIPKDVGEALAGYLCQGRPRCSSRSVFLRIRAPWQGFTSSCAICDIVRRALVRAGLHPARKGSHLLRHALAIKMLRGGASLSEIGEILRHELPSTTEIYAPDQNTWAGRRDRTLLLVAVQTGFRVSELIELRCQHVVLGTGAHLQCTGKGRKDRCTPLRRETATALRAWLAERNGQSTDHVFPNAKGRALSTDGIEYILSKHVATATQQCPSLAKKRVTPHVLRHTAAMELLQNGVDRSVIALWLGHESMETTQVYLHADLALKEKALAKAAPLGIKIRRYRPDDKLLAFLKDL